MTSRSSSAKRSGRAGGPVLVFSATNAMQHLHDLDSVFAFPASARNVLRPGGTLILDVFNPDMAKMCRLPESPYHHKSVADRDGARLDVRATTSYDAAAQVLRFTLDYLRDGVCVRTKKISMRCFFPEELRALCRLAGLDIAQRYGDYDQSLFTSTSPKQLLSWSSTAFRTSRPHGCTVRRRPAAETPRTAAVRVRPDPAGVTPDSAG
ncbi:hypothetical protein SAMN04487983_1002114 [Streptomyces sp. yr375]|uniref:hypothetical protein n=1 Tax=Streptomyces sp. yr375 TaxID=1761906 RepID=UPI0008AC4AD9|nr:hypothetical protein [Streptomyces sp. yr375]SEP89577.1 hypothetical protein SAMN04487983_1002114 [Streptomyces sp. yr375]